MQTPADLLPKKAPPPKVPAACVITGHPARYKDPQTGLPFEGPEAYKELQRRRAAQAAALAAQQQAALLRQQQMQAAYW
jgi:hypothetical protein